MAPPVRTTVVGLGKRRAEVMRGHGAAKHRDLSSGGGPGRYQVARRRRSRQERFISAMTAMRAPTTLFLDVLYMSSYHRLEIAGNEASALKVGESG